MSIDFLEHVWCTPWHSPGGCVIVRSCVLGSPGWVTGKSCDLLEMPLVKDWGFTIQSFVEGFGCCCLFPSPRLSVTWQAPAKGGGSVPQAGLSELHTLCWIPEWPADQEHRKAEQSKNSLQRWETVVGGFQEQISQARLCERIRGSLPRALIWALVRTTLLLQGFPSLTAIPRSQKHT